jgi:hypothetical protein
VARIEQMTTRLERKKEKEKASIEVFNSIIISYPFGFRPLFSVLMVVPTVYPCGMVLMR